MRHKRYSRTSLRVHPWQVLCLTRDKTWGMGKALKSPQHQQPSRHLCAVCGNTWTENVRLWPLFLVPFGLKELGPQQLSRMARSRGVGRRSEPPCTQPGVPLEGSQSHHAFFSPLLHTSLASPLHHDWSRALSSRTEPGHVFTEGLTLLLW